MIDDKLLREGIERCVKCGTCRSVCPTFKVVGREGCSPRGRLTLIGGLLDGEIRASEAYRKQITDCTLCGACKTVCPNGVDAPEIIRSARGRMAEKEGATVASYVLRNLDSGLFVPMAMRLASRLQGLLFKDSSAGSGLLARFPLPVVGGGRLVPPIARTFFLDLQAVKSLGGSDKRERRGASAVRVAFYAGCGVNYLMPNVGTASIEVLKKAGVEVVVPEGQVCCGMPAWASGDDRTARELALKNLDVFEAYDLDYIVTSCATCGHGLKSVFKELLSGADPGTDARVRAFASKVRDISELLIDTINYRPSTGGSGRKRTVTYHDPCHLGRYQGVREAPREVIKLNKDLALKEMKNPCRCCGLGGGLAIYDYGLSMEVTRLKAESVRDSGAEVVATACPGCIVQLRDGLHRFGVKAEVRHVVELL